MAKQVSNKEPIRNSVVKKLTPLRHDWILVCYGVFYSIFLFFQWFPLSIHFNSDHGTPTFKPCPTISSTPIEANWRNWQSTFSPTTWFDMDDDNFVVEDEVEDRVAHSCELKLVGHILIGLKQLQRALLMDGMHSVQSRWRIFKRTPSYSTSNMCWILQMLSRKDPGQLVAILLY